MLITNADYANDVKSDTHLAQLKHEARIHVKTMLEHKEDYCNTVVEKLEKLTDDDYNNIAKLYYEQYGNNSYRSYFSWEHIIMQNC